MRAIPGLDGLRTLAVSLVLATHLYGLSWGWGGVDLFFVLSGFLITGILLESREAPFWPYWRAFLLRRTLRILPLAYVTLAIVFLAYQTAWREQWWWWAYLSNWRLSPRTIGGSSVTHFWSLAIEEQFYLVWPIMVWIVRPSWLLGLCGGGLILAPLLRWAIFDGVQDEAWGRLTPLRMDGLLIGAALAILARRYDLARYREPAVWTLLACAWALAAGLCGPVWQYSVLAVGCGALVLLASTLPLQALNAGPVPWIGQHLSYGLYVIHFPVLLWAHRFHWTPRHTAAVVLVLTVGLALLSTFVLERPLLRLKRYIPMPADHQ